MSILKKLLGKGSQKDDQKSLVYLGNDKTEEPVYWDLETEHNCFFVGNTSDCYKVTLNVKMFIRNGGLEWDFIEIYTPSHEELRSNSEATPQKIKFLLEDLNSMRTEIKHRWESDNESLSKKSILLIINQASLFSMTQEEWEREYPLIPYKASRLLQLRLEELMTKAKDYPLHIMLLDDKFENYGHLVNNYYMDFGVEADENGFLHKVEI